MMDQGQVDAIWKEIGEINGGLEEVQGEIDDARAEIEKIEKDIDDPGWSTFSLIVVAMLAAYVAFHVGKVHGMGAIYVDNPELASCGTPV